MADTPELSLSQFESLTSIGQVGGVLLNTVGPDCNPYTIRFLIQARDRVGIERTPQVSVFADTAVKALSTRISVFDVIGVTVYPLEEKGVHYGISAGAGSYLVDVVFKVDGLRWISGDDAGMARELRDALGKRGINECIVNVIGLASFASKDKWKSLCTSDIELSNSLFSFWEDKPLLYQWNGQSKEALQTDSFAKKLRGGASSGEYGTQEVQFYVGLSDYPYEAVPIDVNAMLAMPKPPDIKKDKSSSGTGSGAAKDWMTSPVLAGLTGQELLVLGIFGYVGYRAVKAWKEGKYGK